MCFIVGAQQCLVLAFQAEATGLYCVLIFGTNQRIGNGRQAVIPTICSLPDSNCDGKHYTAGCSATTEGWCFTLVLFELDEKVNYNLGSPTDNPLKLHFLDLS